MTIKICLFAIYSLFIFDLAAQENNRVFDSSRYKILPKYTYVVLGKFKGEALTAASGFFIYYNRSIYFVTNYHVATRFEPLTQRLEGPIDTLSVVLSNPSAGKAFRPLDIPVKRDSILESKIKNLEVTDVMLLKVPKKYYYLKSQIYFVNDYLDTLFFDKVPNKIIISSKTINPKYGLRKIDTRVILANYKSDYDLLHKILGARTQSRKEEIVLKYSMINFFSEKDSTTINYGNSGSPVFGLFSDSGVVKIKFIGISFGGNPKINRDEHGKVKSIFNVLRSKENDD